MTYGDKTHERVDTMIDAANEMSRFAELKDLHGAFLVNNLPFRA